MFEKIKRNIIISIIAAALIYIGLSIYADFNSVISSFEKFNWLYLPLLLLLSFLNYFTRFIKWDFYLRLLKVNISYLDSFAIFMSGLIMSVTPGKMGELLKAYLVKEKSGIPVSRVMPVILTERITDFISVVFLALIGAYLFNYGIMIVFATGIFFILVVIIISSKKLSITLLNSFSKIKFLSVHSEKLLAAYESAYILLRPVPLVKMIIVSTISWLFECFGFYLILINFGLEVSIMWPIFVYTFSTIAGAITMLPGGLGVTEGSLTYLLVLKGISKNTAVASTFIIRAVTLWFAILVGVISLLVYQKKAGLINIEQIK